MSFALLSFSSLLAVINPVSAASIFVSLTDGTSAASRRRTAIRACVAAALTLLSFQAAGGIIFALFGITVPAFQIAGGLLFAMFAIRAINGSPQPDSVEGDGDPAVVPLAIPTIAGPGAISTVMVMVGQGGRQLVLAAVVLLTLGITLVLLLVAPALVGWLGTTGQRIVARLMGLITAVIGVQLVINGVSRVVLDLVKAAG